MTATNRIGPAVSQRDLRNWAIAGAGLWLPTYLRDSERHHGLVPPYAQLPKTLELTKEAVKHPEDQLPALLIVAPGTTDAPTIQPDRSYMAAYQIAWVAIVHGLDEREAELQASIYGVALTQMVAQQAGAWAEETGYAGPALEIESVELIDQDYASGGEAGLSSRRRTLARAGITFSIVFRNAATSRNPEIVPLPAPDADPGDFPEIVATELQVNREAIA